MCTLQSSQATNSSCCMLLQCRLDEALHGMKGRIRCLIFANDLDTPVSTTAGSCGIVPVVGFHPAVQGISFVVLQQRRSRTLHAMDSIDQFRA